jgi:hypothetical protein
MVAVLGHPNEETQRAPRATRLDSRLDLAHEPREILGICIEDSFEDGTPWAVEAIVGQELERRQQILEAWPAG